MGAERQLLLNGEDTLRENQHVRELTDGIAMDLFVSIAATATINIEWKEHLIDGRYRFKVPARYELIKKIGRGAFGTVVSFVDKSRPDGQKISVKKITDVFHCVNEGKKLLREVKLLKHLQHENISSLLDMYPPESPDFDDVYIVTRCMETDLHRVIYSKQALTEEHHQYFSYQVLCGLKYLHSADVVHRDLKPYHLLVNKDCDLKISGFAFARSPTVRLDEDRSLSSDGVVNRWYQAPETVLLASRYDMSVTIDVWSVGCILCELIGRKPIFQGRDHLDQIKKILHVIGTPTEDDIPWLPMKSPARSFIKKVPVTVKQAWETIYPNASNSAIQAIEEMLTFSPEKRKHVEELLELPYYEELHQPDDEPTAEHTFDWAFDKFTPTKRLLQNFLYLECCDFYSDIVERDSELLDSRGISGLLEKC